MKRIFVILVLLVLWTGYSAQQQMTYSNFLLNDYYYNAAVAGSKNVHMANFSYRNQWTGFDGAPKMMMGNFYGSVRNEQKVGYGVTLLSDRTGLTQNTAFYLNYAQHFKINDKVKLGLGVRPGYMQYRIRLYDAQLADQGDDVLTGSVLSSNAIDFQAGFNLYSDKFYLMGGLQQILGKAIRFTTYNSSLKKHFNLIGGYKYQIPNKKIVLEPAVLVSFVNPVPVQFTGMFKATFDQKYWCGVLYRSGDAAGVNLGMQVKNRLNIGYGYDYTLSGIRGYQSGSHEIVLTYVLTPEKPDIEEEDEELNKSILEDAKENMKNR